MVRPADLVERREEQRDTTREVEEGRARTDGKETDAKKPTQRNRRRKKGTDADGGDQEADDAEEISPQLAEATNVLVDLIAANESSRSTAKNRTGGTQ